MSSHPYIRMTSQWGDHVRSRDKLNALHLQLQETHEHQTRQGAELQWEVPIFEATWPFDHVTNVGPGDNLKNVHSHDHKTNLWE